VEAEGRALVIGFVGSSGVGKTTLLEHLVPALEARGLAVGVVKHASHGFVADRPGKDSYRLYAAGARAVALASREQIALFQRRPDDEAADDPSLDDALETLPPGLDVVLVEGFAWAPIPRVILVKGAEAPRREHLQGGPLVRFVRTREPAPGERFELPAGAVDAVLRDVLRRVLRRAVRSRALEARHAGAPAGMTGVISACTRASDHSSRFG
jgi:molybdopterin-guanine dinucleotide biosynthesis protein MobB